jgi:5'-3' exoribonuclease 1
LQCSRNLERFEGQFDRFDIGAPFHQFEQLLAVLPPSSRNALPAPYRSLMVSPESPIIDYYPEDFALDLNGKRNDWEAVVLIPFIDEKRLLDAVRSVDTSKLTDAEKRRNQLGKTHLFRFDPKNVETHPTTLPEFFSDLREGHSTCVDFDMPTNIISNVFKLPLHARLGLDAPGLTPTFNSLAHSFSLRRVRVNVFGTRPSDKPTQVVSVTMSDELAFHQERGVSEAQHLQMLADRFVGKPCVVRWPHWLEARVVAVSNRYGRADVGDRGGSARIRRFNQRESGNWVKDVKVLAETLLITRGLDCGAIEVLIHAAPLEGMRVQEDGSSVRFFGRNLIEIPVQAVVFNHSRAPDPRYVELPARSIQERFPIGMQLVCNNAADYGRPCVVVGHEDASKIVVEVEERPVAPKFGVDVLRATQLKFYDLHTAAKRAFVSKDTLLKILGKGFAISGQKKIDIGLQLRFVKKREQVVGYVHGREEKGHDQKNSLVWEVSEAAIDLVKAYKAAFPEVFAFFEKGNTRDGVAQVRVEELFKGLKPDEALKKALSIQTWIKVYPFLLEGCVTIVHFSFFFSTKAQPFSRLARVPLGSEAMTEPGLTLLDQKCAEWAKQMAAQKPFRTTRKSFFPKDVRRPIQELNQLDPNTPTDGRARNVVGFVYLFSLFFFLIVCPFSGEFLLADRVKNLLDNGPIPFGLEGFVVATTNTTVTVLFDEEFAGGSAFGGVISGRRVASGIAAAGLLNLSRPKLVVEVRNDWMNKSVDGVKDKRDELRAGNAAALLSKSTGGNLESATARKPK